MLGLLTMKSTHQRQVSLHARSPLQLPQPCCRHRSRELQAVFLAFALLDSKGRPDRESGQHVELRLQVFLLQHAREKARFPRYDVMLLVEPLSLLHPQALNPRRT